MCYATLGNINVRKTNNSSSQFLHTATFWTLQKVQTEIALVVFYIENSRTEKYYIVLVFMEWFMLTLFFYCVELLYGICLFFDIIIVKGFEL